MKYIRAEKKGEDMAPQWRDPTLWVVREEKSPVPVAAFNSERSALNYVLREEFRKASEQNRH
jgi:hypothetical protein